MKLTEKDIDRFHAGYERRGEDECWLWKRSKDRYGYGRIHIGKSYYIASRVAYFIRNGHLPNDLMVCHSCDTPACCNPKHLWLGTNVDNMRDCAAKGRNNRIGQPGEKNPNATLTEEKAKAIIELIAAGKSNKAIALQFGVTHSMVSMIRLGKAWKDLPRPDDHKRFKKYGTFR